jgi:hypothetical protein
LKNKRLGAKNNKCNKNNTFFRFLIFFLVEIWVREKSGANAVMALVALHGKKKPPFRCRAAEMAGDTNY